MIVVILYIQKGNGHRKECLNTLVAWRAYKLKCGGGASLVAYMEQLFNALPDWHPVPKGPFW